MKTELIKTAGYVALGTIISLSAFASSGASEMHQPNATPPTLQTTNNGQDIEAQSIDLFTRLDGNHDGIITQDEFSPIGSTEGFNSVDIDTNGQISQAEMYRAMKSQQGT